MKAWLPKNEDAKIQICCYILTEANKPVKLSYHKSLRTLSTNFFERIYIEKTSPASSSRRHRRQVHHENLPNLRRGRVRHTAEQLEKPEKLAPGGNCGDEATKCSKGDSLVPRCTANGILWSSWSGQWERLVANYLVGLPQPTPETRFWYLGHLLDQADLSPHDVGFFSFGAHLQRLHRSPEVVSMLLRQQRGQTEHNVSYCFRPADVVAKATSAETLWIPLFWFLCLLCAAINVFFCAVYWMNLLGWIYCITYDDAITNNNFQITSSLKLRLYG
jgi:hypothetical protein